MKIKCIKTYYKQLNVDMSEITQGKTYEVIEERENSYTITADTGRRIIYGKDFFEKVEEPKFKIGDKVCLSSGKSWYFCEKYKTIKGYENGFYKIMETYCWKEEELELYEEEDKEITTNPKSLIIEDFIHGESYLWDNKGFRKVEDDMKELTFTEVIANIKEGETWESRHKIIKKMEGTVIVENVKERHFGEVVVFIEETKYKLKLQEINFELALQLYYKGARIRSLVTEGEFFIEDGKHYWSNFTEVQEMADILVNGKEIAGSWVEVK